MLDHRTRSLKHPSEGARALRERRAPPGVQRRALGRFQAANDIAALGDAHFRLRRGGARENAIPIRGLQAERCFGNPEKTRGN